MNDQFEKFVSRTELYPQLVQAVAEDQEGIGDISSQLLISKSSEACAQFVNREAGVLAGGALLPHLVGIYNSLTDSNLKVDVRIKDGEPLTAGSVIADISGTYRDLLGVERIALNYLCRLSGIATLTSSFVREVQGTKASIVDSRKTIPGFRKLSKYAVLCGGGTPNRLGLYDAVLWKDNHLAHIPLSNLAQSINDAVEAAKGLPITPKFFEVEVDTLEQFKELLDCPLDYILLDNMSNSQLEEAVKIRNESGSQIKLEASGGVTLESVRDIALTGVERISSGALTHSSGILDIGLDME